MQVNKTSSIVFCAHSFKFTHTQECPRIRTPKDTLSSLSPLPPSLFPPCHSQPHALHDHASITLDSFVQVGGSIQKAPIGQEAQRRRQYHRSQYSPPHRGIALCFRIYPLFHSNFIYLLLFFLERPLFIFPCVYWRVVLKHADAFVVVISLWLCQRDCLSMCKDVHL